MSRFKPRRPSAVRQPSHSPQPSSAVDFESDAQAVEFAAELVTLYGANREYSEREIGELIGAYMFRVGSYHLKLSGLLWFDGSLPIDPDQQHTFSFPPSAEERMRAGPINTDKHYGKTCAELAALCARLEPAGVVP